MPTLRGDRQQCRSSARASRMEWSQAKWHISFCAPPPPDHICATWLGETRRCSCFSSDCCRGPFLSVCYDVCFEAGPPLIGSHRHARKKPPLQPNFSVVEKKIEEMYSMAGGITCPHSGDSNDHSVSRGTVGRSPSDAGLFSKLCQAIRSGVP